MNIIYVCDLFIKDFMYFFKYIAKILKYQRIDKIIWVSFKVDKISRVYYTNYEFQVNY